VKPPNCETIAVIGSYHSLFSSIYVFLGRQIAERSIHKKHRNPMGPANKLKLLLLEGLRIVK
jgi:hypothetical protein